MEAETIGIAVIVGIIVITLWKLSRKSETEYCQIYNEFG